VRTIAVLALLAVELLRVALLRMALVRSAPTTTSAASPPTAPATAPSGTNSHANLQPLRQAARTKPSPRKAEVCGPNDGPLNGARCPAISERCALRQIHHAQQRPGRN